MMGEKEKLPAIPSDSTLTNLAALVLECRIAMAPPNYSLHENAVAAILEDPGVVEWMNEMKKRGTAPVEREAKTDRAKNTCVQCGKVIEHGIIAVIDKDGTWCEPCHEKAERDAEMNRRGETGG